MSKRLILMLGLVLGIGLIASVAYAEVQSIKVSGDLTTMMLNRNGFNMCDITTQDDTGVIAQTRVRFDADLTDGVTATVRLLNERDWGFAEETSADTDIDLDLAYLTLSEFLYSPLTLIVGRQELRLGSGLVIGDPDTNATDSLTNGLPAGTRDLSVRKAFDGMVGILDYDPMVVTLGYLKANEATWNDERDDLNVYLANVAYDFQDDRSTSAEAYYVLSDFGKTHATQDEDIKTLGARVVSTPLDALTATAEFATQWANKTTPPGDRNDNAWLFSATYDLDEDMWIDTIGVDYTRLGRDWNAMYEDQTPALIANAAFVHTNMQVIGVTATAKPMEDVSLTLRYANLKMIQDPATTNTSTLGGTYTFRDTSTKKDLGDEFDLILLYDYTEDVQLGLSLGYLDSGKAFDSPRSDATQVIGSMKVTF